MNTSPTSPCASARRGVATLMDSTTRPDRTPRPTRCGDLADAAARRGEHHQAKLTVSPRIATQRETHARPRGRAHADCHGCSRKTAHTIPMTARRPA